MTETTTQAQPRDAQIALWMSTFAFTVCFAVWVLFACHRAPRKGWLLSRVQIQAQGIVIKYVQPKKKKRAPPTTHKKKWKQETQLFNKGKDT